MPAHGFVWLALWGVCGEMNALLFVCSAWQEWTGACAMQQADVVRQPWLLGTACSVPGTQGCFYVTGCVYVQMV